MADSTEKTIAGELAQAVKSLRCEHSFPVNSPDGGTLWEPGPCSHCGLPFPDDDQGIPDALREPLASWLEYAVVVAANHPQEPGYGNGGDFRWCMTCQDEETECVHIVDQALAVARVLNGTAP